MEAISTNATNTNPRGTAVDPALLGEIRGFVTSNFYVADPKSLADDTSLLDTGVIDSTGVLEVIAFLEREMSLSVADSEITPENLDSITRIASFVARKRG